MSKSGYSKIWANLRHFSTRLKFGFATKEIHSETKGSNFPCNYYCNVLLRYNCESFSSRVLGGSSINFANVSLPNLA